MACWTTNSYNQYWIFRHARGNNQNDCSAAKCNHCMSGLVNLPTGSSARAIEKALTQKKEDKSAKERCLYNCHHNEPACFQQEVDFRYVEKKYHDKLRKEGNGGKFITNRCCECGDHILLEETEGGAPVNPQE